MGEAFKDFFAGIGALFVFWVVMVFIDSELKQRKWEKERKRMNDDG